MAGKMGGRGWREGEVVKTHHMALGDLGGGGIRTT